MLSTKSRYCCVLYSNAAYYKATRNLAKEFSEVGFIVTDHVIDESFLMKSINESFFKLFDLVIVGSGGRILNLIINYLSTVEHRPLIVSLFPGVVSHCQIDAFISRLRADIVLVNSQEDFLFYEKLTSFLSLKNNSLLSGANWFLKDRITETVQKEFVFFEQIDIPERKNSRRLLLQRLEHFAKNVLNSTLYIKPRDEYLLDNRSLAVLLSEMKTEHLSIASENTSDLVQGMTLGLTISSSVVFEALISRKRILLINDFDQGYNYLDIYEKSGLVTSLVKLNFNRIRNTVVDKHWSYLNVTPPKNMSNKILEIQKTKSNKDYFLSMSDMVLLLIKFYIEGKDSFKEIWYKLTNVKKILGTSHENKINQKKNY